ncbi:hypothetical protein RclHR1_12000001 [Rhizophagus clarus]|uniref:Uncharacterized protein n=1 Tax=Rhizophagus clarus TaxID=94130 RepID=A0A2Z6QI85_9GLOM|nr:hypothetical protein RclHR1_12000001 [Rhizophagus clarus]GES91621.1 hypothetical protein RCL_e24517_RclHR1_12000001 [Rhizophagus clarus]
MFSSKLGFKKRPPVRIGNTGNTSRRSKPTFHQDTNSQLLDNRRFHNQNKKNNNTKNSGFSTKKNSCFKTNQSNRPDVNKLIAGLKALLEQLT